MFDARQIRDDFSRAASQYDEHAQLQQQVRARLLETAREYLAPRSGVLDLGCGTGALAREMPNWNVVCADAAFGMCKQSGAVNALADALPFADEAFDGVFSSLMLQWVANPQVVFSEVLRVLKPTGFAMMSTFAHGTLAELAQAFSAVDDAPHVSSFVDPAVLLLQVAHAGGVVLETYEYTHIGYFDDVNALVRSMKVIGAGNKNSARKKGLMTPAVWRRVQEAYPKTDGKIGASWRVLTMVIGRHS